LELTRAGRLFEIYETSTAAAKSFSCFLPNAIKHLYEQPLETVLQMPAPEMAPDTEPSGGAGLAA